MEFDPALTTTKSTIIRYFKEGLKSSIKTGIDQDNTQLVNYEMLVAKTVRAEAKGSL